MREQQRYDVWSAEAAYERYIGRWSRRVAEQFGAWLGAADGLRWLDVGCGTGGLTAVVAARCRPRTVVGVDRSEGFVARARASASSPAHFVVADHRCILHDRELHRTIHSPTGRHTPSVPWVLEAAPCIVGCD
ncbi:class I SAM-dependent methyltransferase [Streptomyces griseoloalbus]|uniref:class I SAM-dependent methyltransferase n=1 Tax=Streptomyces griseoloalbus TaxID=67303 RepID=UPI0033A15813